MWIVKIGGSWLKNPKLPSLLSFLQKFANQKIVLVVGGGVFAETVRDVYKSNKMTEVTGHVLAMKATEIFAYYLKSINPDILITYKITNFIKESLNLWLPTEKLSFEKKFEKNWESTSDSIATWLYSNTNSKGVVFIKSLSFANEEQQKLRDLQKKNIMDLNVKKYVKRKKNLKIVGPEIIDLFENSGDWEYIVSRLSKVIV
jgi:aspartokinase-like uncharacterized kinase